MFQYPSPFRPTVTFRGSWPSGSPRVWRWVAVWTASAPAGGDQKLTLTFLALTMSQTAGSGSTVCSCGAAGRCTAAWRGWSARARPRTPAGGSGWSPTAPRTRSAQAQHRQYYLKLSTTWVGSWGQKLSVMSLNNHGKNNFLCDNLLAADSSSICPNVVVCLSVVCCR